MGTFISAGTLFNAPDDSRRWRPVWKWRPQLAPRARAVHSSASASRAGPACGASPLALAPTGILEPHRDRPRPVGDHEVRSDAGPGLDSANAGRVVGTTG